jgi:ligand-binding sensor protein/GAF domain-containing protein
MKRNNSKLSTSPLELSDIVDPSYLQAMLEIFSDDTGLASGISDEKGRPITFELNHCSFCKEMIKTKAGVLQCRANDQRLIKSAKKKKKLVFHVCDQGLIDFCVPVIVDGEIIAYFFAGQFRCFCKDKKLETPDQPRLDSLLHAAAETGEKPNISSLSTEFKSVQVLDKSRFNKLKNKVSALVDHLNSVIKKLNEWKSVKKVDDFMRQATNVQTIEELFDLAASSLPNMINARHCSIFTVQRDENAGCDRLVLRKTSYPALKPRENSAYYDEGEGLTGWVWKHKHSLRLDNLQDPAKLAQAQYDDLEWRQKHNDSDEHTSFLGVPMIGHGDKVIGLIRMPHKEGGIPFNKHDQIFLEFLAHHLSWAMECQTAKDKFKRATGLFKVAQELASGLPHSQVLDTAINSSVVLFGRDNKKHFVVILDPQTKKHWKIERIKGGLNLKADFKRSWKKRVFNLSAGFTGWVIDNKESYFSSDLEESINKGEYLVPVEHGESAISAPLLWRDEVYGAISIISNKKFDFSKEKELELFTLAKLVGAAIRNVKPRDHLAILRIFKGIVLQLYELYARLRK